MSVTMTIVVYTFITFIVALALYINGKGKPTQDRAQDLLDAEVLRDPSQRIPGKEWFQVIIIFVCSAIVLWAIVQYHSEIIATIREYMNLR